MTRGIQVIDTEHNGNKGVVAVYVLRHTEGAALVDCGPGSTRTKVVSDLKARGLEAGDITDVLLTHIHLDHGGAAGWWARQGARVHVHPVGAPHLLNPDRLLGSAQRIYGADMERLWGEFLSVPETQLVQHKHGDVIEIGGLAFQALETPGHAEHHFAYLFDDVCFSGDVGGVRLGGLGHIRPPTPPPEIHLDKWRASLKLLRQENFKRLAPTHYGFYEDVSFHLDAMERGLDKIEDWATQEMKDAPNQGQFRADFAAFLKEWARADGYDPAQVSAYEEAAGAEMSADGVYRFWNKYREN
jgi:glyoxylase-like metal-dependent hydrolase (beta-lactamase superfamily II)